MGCINSKKKNLISLWHHISNITDAFYFFFLVFATVLKRTGNPARCLPNSSHSTWNEFEINRSVNKQVKHELTFSAQILKNRTRVRELVFGLLINKLNMNWIFQLDTLTNQAVVSLFNKQANARWHQLACVRPIDSPSTWY